MIPQPIIDFMQWMLIVFLLVSQIYILRRQAKAFEHIGSLWGSVGELWEHK